MEPDLSRGSHRPRAGAWPRTGPWAAEYPWVRMRPWDRLLDVGYIAWMLSRHDLALPGETIEALRVSAREAFVGIAGLQQIDHSAGASGSNT